MDVGASKHAVMRLALGGVFKESTRRVDAEE